MLLTQRIPNPSLILSGILAFVYNFIGDCGSPFGQCCGVQYAKLSTLDFSIFFSLMIISDPFLNSMFILIPTPPKTVYSNSTALFVTACSKNLLATDAGVKNATIFHL